MAYPRVRSAACALILLLAATAHADPAANSSAKRVPFDPKTFGSTDASAPTFIESDTLTLDTAKRIFRYIGHVTVKQGDITLIAEEIEGRYNEKNDIETIVALRNVVVTKPPALKATGQRAFYDARDATVLLSENPAIEQDGSTLNADQIKVYLNENRSEAIGQVRVRVVKKEAAPSPTGR